MKVFGASDHHFYHKNIIKYANRPFNFDEPYCVADNAKLMMDRHNEVVSDEDIILMVGDLSATLRGREEHFSQLLQCLKGRKILVRGNHDHLEDKFYLDAGFEAICDYIIVRKYFICHYPCFLNEFTSDKEQTIIDALIETNCNTIIHGHIHNKDPNEIYRDKYNRINLSVDYEPNNFYPQEFTQPEIIEYFSKL